MDGIVPTAPEAHLLQLGCHAAAIKVDTTIYSQPALLRTCYKFTDRAYLHLSRDENSPDCVVLIVGMKTEKGSIADLMGNLCNELVDQQIRQNLADEAGPVRVMIVAQAFSEGNLTDADRDAGDYEADPRNIGRQR
jgi:His-Xaa-Ser system protein HxsD